uniref:Late embryogenesis abundant protein LEA-2 subgroup domain-containing protein n=1 Tax=Ananas comosus var. bracteatus TaxID=296719 RepID=A0A6V7NKP4_ANACO|nr:unnamed protein product [Ananas comosus var. bracteatus]
MANKRALKTCCVATTLLLFLLILTAIILYFTLLKPKQPRIVATAVDVTNVELRTSPAIALNLTLGADIVVNNRNYAGFSYDDTTTLIFYHGVSVGVAPVAAGTIGARATERISSSVDVDVAKVVENGNFLFDILTGSLNFTSSSAIEGKVVPELRYQQMMLCDTA